MKWPTIHDFRWDHTAFSCHTPEMTVLPNSSHSQNRHTCCHRYQTEDKKVKPHLLISNEKFKTTWQERHSQTLACCWKRSAQKPKKKSLQENIGQPIQHYDDETELPTFVWGGSSLESTQRKCEMKSKMMRRRRGGDEEIGLNNGSYDEKKGTRNMELQKEISSERTTQLESRRKSEIDIDRTVKSKSERASKRKLLVFWG